MPKRYLVLFIILLVTWLAGCSTQTPGPESTATQTVASLPTPVIKITGAPDPESAARQFMNAWKAESFDAMYALLTKDSRENITEEDFAKKYRGVLDEVAVTGLDYEIQNTEMNPTEATTHYRINLQSSMAGELARDMADPLGRRPDPARASRREWGKDGPGYSGAPADF
jgi:hypothetical protein